MKIPQTTFKKREEDPKMNFKQIEIKQNYPLLKLSTFRIGGPCDVLACPKNEEELIYLLIKAQKHGITPFILGGGSNVVFPDEGLRGLVIKLAGDFCQIKIINNNEILVGAGVSFPKLTKIALKLGWSSALGWNGTPGSVGGALIMNAGSRLGCIGDVAHEVSIVNSPDAQKIPQTTFRKGEIALMAKEEINVSYRKSCFPKKSVIIAVKLKCYNLSDKSWLQSEVKFLTQKRRASQPQLPSAGCIFKNPPKLFAAKLLDKAGLKGLRLGRAQISSTHANFIVNLQNASAKDVFILANKAKRVIWEKFSIKLDFEVQFINEMES